MMILENGKAFDNYFKFQSALSSLCLGQTGTCPLSYNDDDLTCLDQENRKKWVKSEKSQ